MAITLLMDDNELSVDTPLHAPYDNMTPYVRNASVSILDNLTGGEN
jgi:hypothetical protein